MPGHLRSFFRDTPHYSLDPATGDCDEAGVGMDSGSHCDPHSAAASSSQMRSRTAEVVSGVLATESVRSCTGEDGCDIIGEITKRENGQLPIEGKQSTSSHHTLRKSDQL